MNEIHMVGRFDGPEGPNEVKVWMDGYPVGHYLAMDHGLVDPDFQAVRAGPIYTNQHPDPLVRLFHEAGIYLPDERRPSTLSDLEQLDLDAIYASSREDW